MRRLPKHMIKPDSVRFYASNRSVQWMVSLYRQGMFELLVRSAILSVPQGARYLNSTGTFLLLSKVAAQSEYTAASAPRFPDFVSGFGSEIAQHSPTLLQHLFFGVSNSNSSISYVVSFSGKSRPHSHTSCRVRAIIGRN